MAGVDDIGAPSSKSGPGFSLWASLIAGATAGCAVDAVLFPLDTLKTRLQAGEGRTAWRLSGLYRGITPALIASAPCAATFFGAYELVKQHGGGESGPARHMAAAIAGELAATVVRVPFEIAKQQMQAGQQRAFVQAIRQTYAQHGFKAFRKVYYATIWREIPFSVLQFPLYEAAKTRCRAEFGRPVSNFEAALCGSAAGMIAAALTNPFDVIKTKVTLQPGLGMASALRDMLASAAGRRQLLRGIGPRVTWIGLGGFFFFGVYEFMRDMVAVADQKHNAAY